jgi:shikimate kinase
MLNKDTHIILIGMSGSGKTTVGRGLSKQLNLPFIDTDAFIESRYKKSISDIFKFEGQTKFRTYESELIDELENEAPSLISVGGGLPCSKGTMTKLLGLGTVIYLKVSVTQLCKRLTQDETKRPLYSAISKSESESYTQELLKKRESTYLKSDIVIDSDSSVEKILNEILRALA